MRLTPAGPSLRTSARRPARLAAVQPPCPGRALHRRSDPAPIGTERLLEVIADDLLEVERAMADARSSHTAWRSWSVARSCFGMDSYAASRIRMCRKRKARSPENTGLSRRTRSRRASASRASRTPGGSDVSSATMLRGTAGPPLRPPRSRHARCPVADRGGLREVPGSWAVPRRSLYPDRLEQECEHLLHEERVPTRCFDDPPSHRLLDVDRTRQVLQERHALGVGQRFEENRRRVRLPSSPLRTKFEATRVVRRRRARPARHFTQSDMWSTRSRNVASPQ